MITETKYYSDDRKFSSTDQAKVEEYEQKQSEQEARKAEVDNLVEQTIEAIKNYKKDYKWYSYRSDENINSENLDDFFRIFKWWL